MMARRGPSQVETMVVGCDCDFYLITVMCNKVEALVKSAVDRKTALLGTQTCQDNLKNHRPISHGHV